MKLRTSFALAALAAALSVQAQYAGSTPPPADLKLGFEAITIKDAKEWLGYLAGPECMGRGSFQPGYQKAAEYMAKHFKAMGLKPMGDDGTYFQAVRISGNIADSTALRVGSFSVPFGDNFALAGVRQQETIKAPLVFLQTNKGTRVPAGVAGKIVIAKLEGVNTAFRRQLSASAKLVINITEDVTPRKDFATFGLPSGGAGVRGRLSPSSAEALMKAVTYAFPATVGEGDVIMSEDKGEASIEIKIDNLKRDVPNVVGLLEGSDPALKNETVGIGAHLDHLGESNGQVYWGADDDGSGSTALLGVLKAMHVNKVKPKRSILFMAFSGEEMGLVGSRFLAEYPPVDLNKMTCELQMDMVGRNSDGVQNGDQNRVDVAAENIDTMRLVGSKRISTELHQLILDMNQHINFRFKYDSEDVYTRSDHYSFAAKGVPIAFQFDGFHPDYHKPTDTIEKINFDKLTNAAKLYYLVAMRAANRAKPFAKDVPQTGDGGDGDTGHNHDGGQ